MKGLLSTPQSMATCQRATWWRPLPHVQLHQEHSRRSSTRCQVAGGPVGPYQQGAPSAQSGLMGRAPMQPSPMPSQQPPAQQGESALVRRQAPQQQLYQQQGAVFVEMSQVVGKTVITRTTGRNLGVISGMWVDPVRLVVVSLDVDDRKGVGSKIVGNFPLARLEQIGDVVLVNDETVMFEQALDGRFGFYQLPRMEVRTRSGDFLGKVRDFSFSPDTGALTRITYDDFGLPFLPLSFFDTFSLPLTDVVNIGVGGLIVEDSSRYSERRESAGVFAAIPSLLRSINSGGSRVAGVLTDGYSSRDQPMNGRLPDGYSYDQWLEDIARWENETGYIYELYVQYGPGQTARGTPQQRMQYQQARMMQMRGGVNALPAPGRGMRQQQQLPQQAGGVRALPPAGGRGMYSTPPGGQQQQQQGGMYGQYPAPQQQPGVAPGYAQQPGYPPMQQQGAGAGYAGMPSQPMQQQQAGSSPPRARQPLDPRTRVPGTSPQPMQPNQQQQPQQQPGMRAPVGIPGQPMQPQAMPAAGYPTQPQQQQGPSNSYWPNTYPQQPQAQAQQPVASPAQQQPQQVQQQGAWPAQQQQQQQPQQSPQQQQPRQQAGWGVPPQQQQQQPAPPQQQQQQPRVPAQGAAPAGNGAAAPPPAQQQPMQQPPQAEVRQPETAAQQGS